MNSNLKQFFAAAFAAGTLAATAACNDRNNESDSDHTTLDTNYSDTRRNSGDTANYIPQDATASPDIAAPKPAGDTSNR